MGGNHTETKRPFKRNDSNEVLGDRDTKPFEKDSFW